MHFLPANEKSLKVKKSEFVFVLQNPYLCVMFHWNIQKYIEEKQLFTLHDKVLVALSGGADSVALLRVLLVLGYHCEAAHCNFHLRGEESDRDERFVNELCKGLGVTLHVTHFDTVTYASRHHVSVEMAARQMHCYSSCPYFSARDFASAAPTALLNYAYWLIHMNYVNPSMDEPPFPPRKFTICDEAHKIVEIVQSHYSPRFDAKTIEKLAKLTDFFNNYKLNNLSKDFIEIKDDIGKLYKTNDNDQLNEILISIRDNLQYRYRLS